MADDLEILVDYVTLLEAELKSSNPERFQQLTQKREGLFPLVQKQKALIATLRSEHQVDQAEIARLRDEIAALRSELKGR
jgi:hypothetical protein